MLKKYCPACGYALDNEDICTNLKCKRRELQLEALEKKEEALIKVQENKETTTTTNIALMKAFFSVDEKKVTLLKE